jgi:peptidoglycan L-alanyl-D-glutamate endopeptidase CwlK
MSQPWKRDQELTHLHPFFREKVEALLNKLSQERLPFRVFEGFRSPQRQQYLFEQGRTRPGNIVTQARPWTSFHQYGLAADFVLYVGGKWSWETSGEKRQMWTRLHQLGRENDLTPLTWELPHLQLPGLDIGSLKEGDYPPDGDVSWAEWLEAAIQSWSATPAAPPVPMIIPERPPLETDSLPLPDPSEATPTDTADWKNYFGGREWRYDESGIYLRDYAEGREPLRTPGEPITCRAIWSLFAEYIIAASKRYGISATVIMMVIATETSFARKYGFTGPHTFRWESRVEVKDVLPPLWGDYSAGPMQTLANTARWVIRQQGLDYDPYKVAPVFGRRPEPPEMLELYDPAINIDVGTAEMKKRWSKTGDDPILVAAAYNAGGLYKSARNPWHLRSTGDHLDRAASWYGDACAVLKEARA